jgi:hypothetical protein
MGEWSIVEANPSEKLVKLHFFAMSKQQPEGEIEFRITVREHASDPGNGMRFIAFADRQTNQNTAPYTPCGWGSSLSQALGECLRAIHRFPYEGPLPEAD